MVTHVEVEVLSVFTSASAGRPSLLQLKYVRGSKQDTPVAASVGNFRAEFTLPSPHLFSSLPPSQLLSVK